VKRKLLLAAAVLLLGAAGSRLPASSSDHGESAMLTFKSGKGGS